jgi:5-methyltetrahydrofolate--homocysteine methyltransferase
LKPRQFELQRRRNLGDILADIRRCVVDIRIAEAGKLAKRALAEGIPAYKIFTECVTKGMEVVGRKYEAGEYFLSELLGAAQVVNEAMQELEPYLKTAPVERTGKVVIGTVRGDIHDIGKNIVKMLMSSAGFEVHDLEVDVAPEKFIDKSKETRADVVGMSALLTTTVGEMKTVIEELQRSGLRSNVKVIIGGAPVSADYARQIGADAAAEDAAHGVRLCKEWVGRA